MEVLLSQSFSFIKEREMAEIDLHELFGDTESDRLERKPSLAQMGKILQTVCAFANDLPQNGQPGILFIGVHDDGTCADFDIDDDVLKRLSEIRSDGRITPFPVLTVQKETLEDCPVAVLKVEPSDSPPVRYKGRVYVRIGPTTRVATPEEERRLTEKRRAADLPFDLRPLPSASLDDLDLDLFRRTYLPTAIPADVMAQNSRSLEQQLASLRFATLDQPPFPTVLGILVSGIDPRRFIPGDYIQFLRIDGIGLTDPIKTQSEIDGPLPELLAQLDEILRAHVSVATDLSGDREARHPDYPLPALQQLTRNAVMHRNYEGTNAPVRLTWFEDRIEIQNPGGPYGQVTRENFGQPGITDYRNAHLAGAMNNLGYVQRFGMGIQIAREALEDNGNPPPEFSVYDSHVLVTLRPVQ